MSPEADIVVMLSTDAFRRLHTLAAELRLIDRWNRFTAAIVARYGRRWGEWRGRLRYLPNGPRLVVLKAAGDQVSIHSSPAAPAAARPLDTAPLHDAGVRAVERTTVRDTLLRTAPGPNVFPHARFEDALDVRTTSSDAGRTVERFGTIIRDTPSPTEPTGAMAPSLPSLSAHLVRTSAEPARYIIAGTALRTLRTLDAGTHHERRATVPARCDSARREPQSLVLRPAMIGTRAWPVRLAGAAADATPGRVKLRIAAKAAERSGAHRATAFDSPHATVARPTGAVSAAPRTRVSPPRDASLTSAPSPTESLSLRWDGPGRIGEEAGIAASVQAWPFARAERSTPSRPFEAFVFESRPSERDVGTPPTPAAPRMSATTDGLEHDTATRVATIVGGSRPAAWGAPIPANHASVAPSAVRSIADAVYELLLVRLRRERTARGW